MKNMLISKMMAFTLSAAMVLTGPAVSAWAGEEIPVSPEAEVIEEAAEETAEAEAVITEPVSGEEEAVTGETIDNEAGDSDPDTEVEPSDSVQTEDAEITEDAGEVEDVPVAEDAAEEGNDGVYVSSQRYSYAFDEAGNPVDFREPLTNAISTTYDEGEEKYTNEYNYKKGTGYYLSNNLSAGTVRINEDINLDLNGYAIRGNGKGPALIIEGGATVHIYDGSRWELIKGKLTDTKAYKGHISGGKASAIDNGYAGGICVESGATLYIHGGIIDGNEATEYTDSNEESHAGMGGAITAAGDVVLYDGEIKNNSANNGGAVYVDGSFTMNGGTIESNNAVVMTGESGTGTGAGVYVNTGEFTMNGGTIKSNTSAGEGGGVYSKGTTLIAGGTITANKASEGGGIYAAAGISLGEGKINVKNNTGGNLYLDNSQNVLLGFESAPSSDSTIGVTLSDVDDVFTDGYEDKVLGYCPTTIFSCDGDSSKKAVVSTNGGAMELVFGTAKARTINSTMTVDYSDPGDALKGALDGDTVKLLADVEDIEVGLAVNNSITLDLNDKVLSGDVATGPLITVTPDQDDDKEVVLTLTDSAAVKTKRSTSSYFAYSGGSITGYAGGIGVEKGARLLMDGGNIVGCKDSGVKVAEDADFEMLSGVIADNTSDNGGGIHSAGGTRINGGEICKNHATENGGGIYSSDRLVVYPASIHDNSADGDGGGIYSEKDSYLYGPVIKGNSAGGKGGGIASSSDLLIDYAEFTSNTAEENGGAIYSSDFVNVRGVLVRNCTTEGNGGGIFVDSDNIKMSGGGQKAIIIKDNIRDDGGNKTPDNLYLGDSAVIEICSELKSGSDIGVGLSGDTEEERNRIFTSGWGENAGSTPDTIFTSDTDPEWAIREDTDSETQKTELRFVKGAVEIKRGNVTIPAMTLETVFDPESLDEYVQTGDEITLFYDPVLTGDLEIPEGMEVTLDLNDHVMDTSAGAITVEGNLTFNGGPGKVKRYYRLENDELVRTAGDAEGALRLTGGCILGGTNAIIAKEDSSVKIDYVNIAGCSGYAVGSDGGNIQINRCKLAFNGGGVEVGAGAEVRIEGSDISYNESQSDGGGIRLTGEGAKLFIRAGNITYNSAANGGGIYVGEGSTAEITRVDIIENEASINGGGIYLKGTLKFDGCITYNKATEGGGIYADEGSALRTNAEGVPADVFENQNGNVYLSQTDNVINVTYGLDARSKIGIYRPGDIETNPELIKGIPFTTGYSAGVDKDIFESDNDSDLLVTVKNGELCFSDAEAKIKTVKYATLQEALDSAVEGDTITLITDIGYPVTYSNAASVKLDLNGKKLEAAEGSAITVTKGTLTIADEGEGDDIAQVAAEDENGAALSVTGGAATVKGGIFAGLIKTSPDASLVIEDGYFRGDGDKVFAGQIASPAVVIKGGYFAQEYDDENTPGAAGTIAACVDRSNYGNGGTTEGDDGQNYTTCVAAEFTVLSGASLSAKRGEAASSVNNLQVGDALTVSPTPAAVSKKYLEYEWYRADSTSGEGALIQGAVSENYIVSGEDFGSRIYAVITQTIGAGEALEKESLRTGIVGKKGSGVNLDLPVIDTDAVTTDTVVVDAREGFEYVIKESGTEPVDEDWDKSLMYTVIFTGLAPGKDYTVWGRQAETAETSVGRATSSPVTTKVTSTNIVKQQGEGTDFKVGDTLKAVTDPVVTGATYVWKGSETGHNYSEIPNEVEASYRVQPSRENTYIGVDVIKNEVVIGSAETAETIDANPGDYVVDKINITGFTMPQDGDTFPVDIDTNTEGVQYVGHEYYQGEEPLVDSYQAEDGLEYSLKIWLLPSGDPYVIADDPLVTFGGVKKDVTVTKDDDYTLITYTFTVKPEITEIDTVNINGFFVPDEGEMFSKELVIANKEGFETDRFDYEYYEDAGTDPLSSNAGAESNTYYKLKLYLLPSKGFELAKDFKVVMDGREIPYTKSTYDDGSGDTYTVVTYRFKTSYNPQFIVKIRLEKAGGGYGSEADETYTMAYSKATADAYVPKSYPGFTLTKDFEAEDSNGDIVRWYKGARNRYRLSFDANGGVMVESVNLTVKYGANLPELPKATNGELNLKEWNTRADGKGKGYKTGSVMDLVEENNAAITLYAIWTTGSGGGGESIDDNDPDVIRSVNTGKIGTAPVIIAGYEKPVSISYNMASYFTGKNLTKAQARAMITGATFEPGWQTYIDVKKVSAKNAKNAYVDGAMKDGREIYATARIKNKRPRLTVSVALNSMGKAYTKINREEGKQLKAYVKAVNKALKKNPVYFDINPANLGRLTITAKSYKAAKQKFGAIKAAGTVSDSVLLNNGKAVKLKLKKDFTTDLTSLDLEKRTIVINGTGNYTGRGLVNITVIK